MVSIMKNKKARLVLGVAMICLMGSLTACGSTTEKAYEQALSEYPVYETFEQEYKDMGSELVAKYIKEGKTEEEACKQAISEVLDKQFNDECDFLTKYTIDMDGNGIYDAVENGEITQEEIDNHFRNWLEAGSGIEAEN